MSNRIGLQIMRPVVYTDGTKCQIVLTELGDDKVIISFHTDTGTEEIGTQQIAVVANRRQFVGDALALFYRIGEDVE